MKRTCFQGIECGRESHLSATLPSKSPFSQGNCSDDVHIENGDRSEEVTSYHLLAVSCHQALTRCEVFWTVDDWGKDERYVWGVDVSAFEEGRALVTNQDLVGWEVWVNEH